MSGACGATNAEDWSIDAEDVPVGTVGPSSELVIR
jgi:hypothetical protein